MRPQEIPLSRTVEACLFLTLAGAIAAWQLFAPPIVGLADQGDFVRVLGPLGYAPDPPGPQHKYAYVTRHFVRDASYREPRWEQPSSEFLLARLALAFDPDEFDITRIGFVHWVFFLAAFARLLQVTRSLRHYRLVWIAMTLILTDVGYVAYWNSLYTEPAACIWFLFLLAECIAYCIDGRITVAWLLRWNLFAVLWIAAKTQNAVLCVPLAAYLLVVAWRHRSIAAGLAIAAVLSAGAFMYRSLPDAPRVLAMYDMIFMAVLPESPDPAADLQALGLDPSYARYAGTLAWSPGTGVADGFLVNAVLKVTPLRLMTFYAARPARMWAHLRKVLSVAFSLRPEFCGNFDASAGRPPGARSETIALWSHFHENALPWASPLVLMASALVWGRHRRWAEFAACLSCCCLAAFVTAAFGDAWDVVKHHYMFNLLLDTCLVLGAIAVIDRYTGSPQSR